jgi:hypothetical protein
MISSDTPFGIDAKVDHPARLVEVGLADRRKRAAAAERHGAHGQRRNLQPGTAESAVFHVVSS